MYKITIPVISSTAYKYKQETLKELRRCRADRVALTLMREMDYRFSSEKSLDMLSDMLEFFKNEGLNTLVWIGQTIGHDRVNPPIKDYGFQNIRLLSGDYVFSFCPLDDSFTDAIAQWIERVARLNPSLIILDDDFRMGEHFGCCCPLHMKRFAAEVGEDVPIDKLESLLLHKGERKYRDAWLKVQGNGLRNMARKIRAAVDRVDKSIRLGACITPSRWDADGADPIEIGKILAGENKPFLRLFGAPYHINAFPLGVSVERERAQLNWCKGEGFEVISEGDTYPRPRFACPASYLECFDMMLRADGSSDGILRYMMDYISSPAYESGYGDIYTLNYPVYEMLDEMFSEGSCVGITPYLPGKTLTSAEGNKFYNRNNISDLTFEFGASYGLLTENSLPSTYEKGYVKVVFGESARKISETELSSGAIIDIDAAAILMSRGIDVGIEKISERPLFINEGFFSNICEHFPTYSEDVRLDAIDFPKIEAKPDAQYLSYVTDEKETHGFVFKYENSASERFLVLPFSARQTFGRLGYVKSYLRKRQIYDAVEWLCGKPLDAYLESSTPSVYTLVKKQGERLCVGMWNLFPDKASNVRVKLAKAPKTAVFKNCTGHVEGDVAIIDSIIYPYEFAGTIFE